jgi:hypothetical protein
MKIAETHVFILGYLNRLLYFAREIVYSSFDDNKLNILFSDHKWEKRIRFGFLFTRHKVTFDSLDQDKNYDLVIPIGIEDIAFLYDKPGQMINNLVPLPSIKSVELCNNKSLLNNEIIKNGFKSLIPNIEGKINFPYILKKKIDAWGNNSHIIINSNTENKFSNLLENPDYFRQEIIKGKKEYATHIVIRDKNIVTFLNIEYIFRTDFYIKGKEQHITTRITKCPHINIFQEVLVIIEFEGLCCINYKEVDGQPLILEINPRFGGSLSPFFFSFIRRLS